MSMPWLSRETPLSHPRLFTKVQFRDVQRGDIFQGKRDESQWYENTDPNQKQSRHTYWRLRKAPAKKKPTKKPAPKKKPVKPAKRKR